jgi:uncharacterized lipoprotein YbaY
LVDLQKEFDMRLLACWLVLLLFASIASAQAVRDRDGVAGFGGAAPSYQDNGSRWLHPGNGGAWRPPTYQLGVNVRNTERGVVLTNVLAGSAAQRAGLERSDTIISVAGYQVGYVGRQLYDLADEINARAGTSGQVLMLIQNGRNGELRNITIDFGVSRSSVTGAARWGTDVSLSRNAILVVRIVDVTNPAWRDSILVEQIVRNIGRGSAQYEIAYSPSSLQPNHRYAISAHVRDGNSVAFELSSPREIDLSGGNQRLDFTLDRARGSGGNQSGGFPTAQIVDLYQNLLGRPPTAREITLWQAEFGRGATLNDVRRQLLGGSEYYDKNRNNDDRFLNDAYGSTQGRPPTADELARMRQQLQKSGGSRTDLVRDLLSRLDAGSGQPPK